MAFAKAFSTDEKAYIVKNYGKQTNGDIAKEISKISGEERTADGVRSFYVDYNKEYIPIELMVDINLRGKIGDAGLTPIDVYFIFEEALRARLCPKPKVAKSKAKVAN